MQEDKTERISKSPVRHLRRLRKDESNVPCEDVASLHRGSLDDLRREKGDEYFKVLFRLPERDQYAEMSTWTAEDHVAACRYMDARPSELRDDRADEDEFVSVRSERGVFDEEDHFD